MRLDIVTTYQGWSGSLEQLAETAIEVEQRLGIVDPKPANRRTIVYYRGKNIIDPPEGKKCTYRHLLQILLARKLSREGWSVKQMSQAISALNEAQLFHYLGHKMDLEESLVELPFSAGSPEEGAVSVVAPSTESTQRLPKHLLAVQMLARGVIQQYRRVTVEEAIVDGTQLPDAIHRAMGLLGQLCLAEGKEDTFASLHEVLFRCRSPLGHPQWGLEVFQESGFPYAAVTLVDPDHRCPTADCMELAEAGDEANIHENFSFAQLKQCSAAFGGLRHDAYTTIREFIARHPTTTRSELFSHLKEHKFAKAEQFLSTECYQPISSHHLIHDHLYLCEACGAPLRQLGGDSPVCIVKQCSRYHRYGEGKNIFSPDQNGLILRPHILAYWFGPAIDELAIYDAARERLGNVSLYPDSDACDISIDGYDVGIDVKSYIHPQLLANALNRSISGLEKYKRKIIAISDSITRGMPGYLEILESQYRGKSKVEFKSVSDVISSLEAA